MCGTPSTRTSNSVESDLDLCASPPTSLRYGRGRKDKYRLAILDACEDKPVGHVRGEANEEPRMELQKIWIEQCEAARGIEDEFGTQKALDYLVGEKFLNYLEAAEKDSTCQAELPAFVAEIKSIFEPWQLAECLEKARQTEPFDPSIYEDDDPEDIEMERKADLLRCAPDLLVVERAKELLLGE